MHSSLQRLFDQLEAQRETTLVPLRAESTDRLNHSPGGGKWSAAEVLSHVLAAEQLSLMYMKKKIQGINQADRSGAWEELKMALLIVSQRIPGLKFRAPRKVVENTRRLTRLEEIEAAWGNHRKELRELLEQIPSDRLDRKIYKHPFAGYINARQALVFFREHIIHHTPQIRKLLQ